MVVEKDPKLLNPLIQEQERRLLELDAPKVWQVTKNDNLEHALGKDFDKFMLILSEHTRVDIRKISVLSFYNLVELLKERQRKQKSQ